MSAERGQHIAPWWVVWELPLICVVPWLVLLLKGRYVIFALGLIAPLGFLSLSWGVVILATIAFWLAASIEARPDSWWGRRGPP
jgi:hypothetical protein